MMELEGGVTFQRANLGEGREAGEEVAEHTKEDHFILKPAPQLRERGKERLVGRWRGGRKGERVSTNRMISLPLVNKGSLKQGIKLYVVQFPDYQAPVPLWHTPTSLHVVHAHFPTCGTRPLTYTCEVGTAVLDCTVALRPAMVLLKSCSTCSSRLPQ